MARKRQPTNLPIVPREHEEQQTLAELVQDLCAYNSDGRCRLQGVVRDVARHIPQSALATEGVALARQYLEDGITGVTNDGRCRANSRSECNGFYRRIPG